MIRRKSYPSDVSDEEWSLVAPYLTLMREDASQRDHSLRELFNGLRYLIRYGIAWRAMPNDLPPWFSVYQQARRWLAAGVFETLAQDLRAVLRLAAGRHEEPTAAIIDSRTLRSTPESGPRAGYDGAKRKRGSKLYMAVDALGGDRFASAWGFAAGNLERYTSRRPVLSIDLHEEHPGVGDGFDEGKHHSGGKPVEAGGRGAQGQQNPRDEIRQRGNPKKRHVTSEGPS
jgi:transposase